MYHRENDQEDFLVLAGEALAIVEGGERPLRQWDFVHCPPWTSHMIIGAGQGPCLILAVGARDRSIGPDWGPTQLMTPLSAMGRASSARRQTRARRVPDSPEAN
jgi:oxalate decarboxylase/phosphoglucose isomerase-like protein (cupin superfamily)